MTGGPGKEQGTNKPPPTRRAQERSKSDTTCPTTSQNPSLWHPSWLNKAYTTRKDSESEWLAKENPETNPITIKPETASHMAKQFSWVPLSYFSLPWCIFLIKSLALSAHMSPWMIHFQVLDKSPLSDPGRGPPSCSNSISNMLMTQGVYIIISTILNINEWVSEVTQSCPALCNPMDCSIPGSFVHGIFQARVLKWVAISFSRGSSWPRDQTWVSHIAGRCFTIWATREALSICWIGCNFLLRFWLQ